MEYNITQNMSLPACPFFAPLTPAHKDVLLQLTSIVLKGFFCYPSPTGQQEEVLLALTQHYLIVSQNQQGQEINQFCPLTFDVKFEVFRKQWSDEKTPGEPIGIRFDKGPNSQFVDFYQSNSFVVQQWISVLSKKINQRNFHKLFKAKKKIGKGAFATVYLAERLVDKKLMAVKAFSKQKQYSGDKGKESLENEIQIMRKINHPNLITLEEVYETDNSIYVILEYMEGRQLNEQIKNGRKFTPDQCVTIIGQILSALEHLASLRIIHRDLKPDNIMFKKEGSLQLSICDFGLATHADESKYLFVRCGTPGFVAPEIINIKDMNTKSEPISDIFSAGVIFHLLLLGCSIFPGKKYNDVLAQNRTCEFNFKKEQYSSIAPAALNLLVSMLQKNPRARVSAQDALNFDYFKSGVKKSVGNGMDIQQVTVGKKKSPFGDHNFTNSFNLLGRASMGERMLDENTYRQNENIGQSVKKKTQVTGNLSGLSATCQFN